MGAGFGLRFGPFMKNSREYSKKVQKLYRSLKRKLPKVEKVVYDEPADALVYAIISENLTEATTQSEMKRFADYFADWNDLRVSQPKEIIEVLGDSTPVTMAIASTLNRVLKVIFDEYHKVSMEALKKIGKRPARGILEKMDGVSRFVVDYCMLTSLQGHAIPLTQTMIEYLRSNKLVHPNADHEEIEGFLAKQTPAKNAYEFYALLRRASESSKKAESNRRDGLRQKAARRTKQSE
jgi:endonuclease III